MKVRLEKSFPLPGAADAAWRLLQDIEAVAACMPGARITERLDERRYKGAVTVKVGPATLSFRGELEIQAADAQTRTLRLVGRGTDSTGSSGASMELTARIEGTAGDASTLVGACELSMSGKAAAFGARMFVPVSDQILKQFADNFAAQVCALQSRQPAAAPRRELDGLALAWAGLKGWLRGLFAGRKA